MNSLKIISAILVAVFIFPMIVFAEAGDVGQERRTVPVVSDIGEGETDQSEVNNDKRNESALQMTKEREERMLELRERFETRRAEMLKQREERREQLLQKISERLTNGFENLMDRLAFAGEHLSTLAEQINSRISKFEEQGKDMTTPKANMVIAEGKIGAVDDAIGLAKTNIENILLGDGDLQAKKGLVREEVSNVKDALKVAHEALVEVVKSIKASVPDVDTEDGADDEE